MGKRIIVCGGRDYWNRVKVDQVLSAVEAKHGIDAIIQGVANGADLLAAEWGWDHDIPVGSYPADWSTHGKKAGILRNIEMLKGSNPDALIAFPGGRGTAHMVGIAKAAGLFVWEIEP